MKVDAPMDSYAARLASFNATLTTKKKRASDVKGAKVLKWPHKAPSPPQLAKAGFFYKPTANNPDNATCYLCHCNLDGWEEEDDPISEHLKHSPSCGWANTAFIEQAVEQGERDLEDPTSPRLMDARTMTFGSTWPHESKRGWVCKIQKMVEAGWHYCPTLESDDFVRCAYCNLSLDGWEPKDNPYDEHQRRSPECMFFSLPAPSQPLKSGKTKKRHTSKASRMSTQSDFSLAHEGPSAGEDDQYGESDMSTAESVKPTKGGKGGMKGKKTKAQELIPKQDDTQLASSFIEPEDDDFEVKVAQPSAMKSKGKKRNSEEMVGGAEPSSNSAPQKRRMTRARNSVASVHTAPEVAIETEQPEQDQDMHMTDPEDMPQPSKPIPKKSRKGTKKRGSSTARKASSKSIASEASLRAGMPNEEEIDAALEEDLNRSLTDDGEDDEPEAFKPPQGRRLTRSTPGPNSTDASIAPTRRTTRTSTVNINDSVPEPYPVNSASTESEMQLTEDVEDSLPQPLPKAKTNKKTGTRKASAKQKAKEKKVMDVAEIPDTTTGVIEAVKPKHIRGRNLSQQGLSHDSRTSNISASQAGVDTVSKVDSSMVGFQTQEDDSGHETDATTNGRPKRRKKASTAKKMKGGKKVGPKSRNIENVVQPASVEQLTAELQDAAAAPAKDAEDPEPARSKKPTKKQVNAAKVGPKPKEKKAASMIIESEEDVPAVDVPEPEVLAEEPSPSVAASVHPTPHSTPGLAPSPQSSDAENQPPSSRPSQSRPPLSFESSSKYQENRIPLAVMGTPCASPSKGNFSKLQSTFPWTAVDINQIFHGTPDAEKENGPFANSAKMLTSPEKGLTVEEWIKFNAQRGEEKLRSDCERLVGKFEDQGVRALKTLEGIVCVD